MKILSNVASKTAYFKLGAEVRRLVQSESDAAAVPLFDVEQHRLGHQGIRRFRFSSRDRARNDRAISYVTTGNIVTILIENYGECHLLK